MIKIVLFDIDGVITDSRIIVDETGRERKSLSLRDVDAIYEIKRRGYKIGAITGESTGITNYFEGRFPWDYFYRGCKDKVSVVQEIEALENITTEHICYIGDGKYDVAPVEYVGLGVCPMDAIAPVKAVADVVLPASGSGALWDLVEHLECLECRAETGFNRFFKKVLSEHVSMFQRIASDEILQQKIMAASLRILETFRNGGQVLLFGNGGSAADAQHIATEFVSRFYKERAALNAEALTTNTSSLTAIGNDYIFDDVFMRQVEAKGRAGDLLWGFTTSGTSKNVLKALEYGRKNDMATVLFTGENRRHYDFADIEINAPSGMTPRVQEAHLCIGHLICEYVEHELFGSEL